MAKGKLFVFLFPFLLPISFTQKWHDCPAALIDPCECMQVGSSFEVKCSDFTSVSALDRVFVESVDRPFDKFLLQQSSLNYLKADWIRIKRIQNLHIQDSRLVTMFDRIPDSTDLVYGVIIEDVRFLRGIYWKYFHPLEKLIYLTVKNTEVKKIDKDFKENIPPGIKKVLLSGTKTRNIGDDAFQNLKHLFVFQIMGTQVSILKRSMFANPSRMVLFDARNNRIESLPDDFFDGFGVLREVFLGGNKIVYFTEAVFGRFLRQYEPQLQFEGNPVMCDCSIAWLVRRTIEIKLEGTCVKPADLKSRDVSDLKKDEFAHCP